MMITGETVVASAHLPPQLPALPGDVNDALRKAYAKSKTAVELRPVIDQTILNAARENARQSMPFYKKIPWYTQFSMAGAVFGSLFLSSVVIYKTVVHKHDKGIEELVTAEVAVKTEEARKKAPMVVSILAENGGAPILAVAPAAPAVGIAAPPLDAAKATLMASAEPMIQAKVLAQPAPAAALGAVTESAKVVAKADTTARQQDRIILADAAPLANEVRSRRADAPADSRAGTVTLSGSKKELEKAKEAKEVREANIVIAAAAPAPAAVALAPPAPTPVVAQGSVTSATTTLSAAPARAAAPAIGATTSPAETAQAWQARVEILQRTGKIALAKTELKALLKRYPDTVLTNDLKRLLAD